MNIEITNESMIVVGTLIIVFLPQLHLFFLFVLIGLCNLIDTLTKFIVYFVDRYALPIVFYFSVLYLLHIFLSIMFGGLVIHI